MNPSHPGPQGPRRPQLAVRVSEQDIATIDEFAAEADVTRSEMVRRLLAAAVSDPKIRRTVTRGPS